MCLEIFDNSLKNTREGIFYSKEAGRKAAWSAKVKTTRDIFRKSRNLKKGLNQNFSGILDEGL